MEKKILSGLNTQQLEAVTTTEGYIRVIAGAGSGKTKALTHRFTYLVETLGVSPSNILCVTFTNKASAEMKKRIRSMIGDADLGKISTFHGFCVQLLREDCHVVQYPSKFVILDEEDVDSILKICFERLGINSRNYTFSSAKKDIGSYKLSDYYIELLSDPKMDELLKKREQASNIPDKVFYEYLYEQRKNFGFDFDDLINFGLYILKKDTDVRIKWQKRLEYIMVDEFQDVSLRQYALASILSEYHKNLFVVGDPDQTIYTWRGAQVEFILNFDKVYPSCKTIIMDRNYRSLPNVINASNALIRKNTTRIDKDLIPIRQGTGQAVYFHAKTQFEEADWISNQLLAIQSQGESLSNIAILYRAHYVSRNIEESLVRSNIPYILYSGIEFYRRKEIKDILSYLRLICVGDDISFLRVINEPNRGIGKKRIEVLKEYAEKHNCFLYDALCSNLNHSLFIKTSSNQFVAFINQYRSIYNQMSLTDLLAAILNDSNYEVYLRTSGDEERLDNLAELKQSIFEYETTAGEEVSLEDYLEHIALFTNMDNSERPDSVKLMTIHTAKGLEFPYVFVSGMSEGIFPSKRTDTKEKLEEERRLAYVSFTRAQDRLFLTDAEGINYDGSFRYPSRFIFNAEQVNLDYVVELSPELLYDAQGYISINEKTMENKIAFSINDSVTHSVFGEGIILEIDEKQSCYIIQFNNLETTRSINFGNSMIKNKVDNSLK